MADLIVIVFFSSYDKFVEKIMQKLYDQNMQLIGFLCEDRSGKIAAYDAAYCVLGYYYRNADKTYDREMRYIGRGNHLARFFGACVQLPQT